MTSPRGIHSQDGPGINLHSMLMISLVIHLAVLSSGVFLQISSTPKMTFGPVYSVQLVNMPAASLGSAPTSSLSRDILATDRQDRAVMLKKQSEAPLNIPIRRMESPASRRPEIDQALDRIKKKAAAEPPAGAQSGTQQDRPAGAAAGNAKFNDYYRVIWSKIKGQWALPGGILPKGGLEAVVHVRILRNGSLTEIGFEKRSGNAYFDNSALRAVNKSNPLPPLPEWFRESSLDVGIRFHSAELM